MSRHILTAVAWPYANGPRHIGHVAGFGVPSDVFSRYQRLAGNNVLMVSGTDEHGTPILVQADNEGVAAARARRPLQPGHRRGPAAARARPTTCSRVRRPATTTPSRRSCSARSIDNGYIDREADAIGAVSPSTGRTLPDRYIEGTCPICGYDGARGDQCDNCGNQLDPDQLINPRSRINGETPKFIETEHFFLDLPAFADALGSWLQSRTDWRPNVLKFSLNLLDELKPRAMTPRPRLGRADPAARLGGPHRQAALRVVRRGHRLPVGEHRVGPAQRRRRCVARVVDRARLPSPTTSWARTTSRSTRVIWPAILLGYDGERRAGGTPGLARRPRAADRGRVE